jgi:hypothetical protein
MSCRLIQLGSYPFAIIRTLKGEDNVEVDVSSASLVQLVVKSPSGVKKTFTGSFVTDGVDGKVQYVTTSSSDLDETGTWTAQFVISISGGQTPTGIFTFVVSKNVGA